MNEALLSAYFPVFVRRRGGVSYSITRKFYHGANISGIFARVGWPNIGPAAAGPAGPAPTGSRTKNGPSAKSSGRGTGSHMASGRGLAITWTLGWGLVPSARAGCS